MSLIQVSSEIEIVTTNHEALAAISDYQTIRPKILPTQFHDYRVTTGGIGGGTIAEWVLQATKKRSRNIVASIESTPDGVIERDANSTLTTTYSIKPTTHHNHVIITTTTSWQGAKGIGGFFERTFAPKGLRAIQNQLLFNLKKHLESH